MIDIGGPSMPARRGEELRARARRCCRPEQYGVDPRRAARDRGRSRSRRGGRLARRGVRDDRRVRGRDRALVRRPRGVPRAADRSSFEKVTDLAYGENPHQRAAYYAELGAPPHLLSRVEQLHGQPALVQQPQRPRTRAASCSREFDAARLRDRQAREPVRRRGRGLDRRGVRRARSRPTRCRRSGWSSSSSTGPVSAELGGRIAEQFVDVLLAPDYDEAALDALRQKPDTRILVDRERRRFDLGESGLQARATAGCSSRIATGTCEDRETMEVVDGSVSRGRVGRPALRVARLQARRRRTRS